MFSCCVWLHLLQARRNDVQKGCLKEAVWDLMFSGASPYCLFLNVHSDVADRWHSVINSFRSYLEISYSMPFYFNTASCLVNANASLLDRPLPNDDR